MKQFLDELQDQFGHRPVIIGGDNLLFKKSIPFPPQGFKRDKINPLLFRPIFPKCDKRDRFFFKSESCKCGRVGYKCVKTNDLKIFDCMGCEHAQKEWVELYRGKLAAAPPELRAAGNLMLNL